MTTNYKKLSVEFDIDSYEGENAFLVLGHFGKAARNQGYSKDEIQAVHAEATSGDYDHLISTIKANCEES